MNKNAAATQKRGAQDALPRIVALRDIKAVQDAMAVKYDMFVSDAFAADLIAFVDACSAIGADTAVGRRIVNEPVMTPEDFEAMLHAH